MLPIPFSVSQNIRYYVRHIRHDLHEVASASTCDIVACGEAIPLNHLSLGDLSLVAESSRYTQERYDALRLIGCRLMGSRVATL